MGQKCWGWVVVIVTIAATSCGGSGSKAAPTTTPARVLTLTVATSNGLVARNVDDVNCGFGVDRGFGTPPTPFTYTVKDEAGTIVATGALSIGNVTSKRPTYRCTADEKVTLRGPAKFVQVEFVNGQRATGPADAPLAVELT